MLDGLDFAVRRGSVLGLLGPNGAGKTPTVKILGTLLAPDAGRALVNGFDVVREAHKVRASIGLTGQYAAVDDLLTGRENLEMMGRLNRLSKADCTARAGQLLEQFDLAEAGTKPVKTYSGGMRRKLDLAASLIASPSVIFLDEPTTGLDPRSRMTLWEIIKQLAATETTILLTTQYMEKADYLADRIMVVDKGRIIAEGTPDELKARVGSDALELVLPQGADLDGALKALGAPGAHADARRRCIGLPAKGGVAELKAVLARLESAGIAVESVSMHRPTLDDAFLTLTGHATGEDAGNGKEAEHRSELYWSLENCRVLTLRSLKHMVRNLDQLLGVAMMPILFLLLFRYVFGGAINTGGTTYVNYLVAGILVVDLNKGIVDRFRSLPMASGALLVGHVTADLVRNVLSAVVMILAGFVAGFRPTAGPREWLLVLGLILLFTFATWLFRRRGR